MLELSDLLRTEMENLRSDIEDIHAYLVDAFGEWVLDPELIEKIMVSNPEKFYSF